MGKLVFNDFFLEIFQKKILFVSSFLENNSKTTISSNFDQNPENETIVIYENLKKIEKFSITFKQTKANVIISDMASISFYKLDYGHGRCIFITIFLKV